MIVKYINVGWGLVFSFACLFAHGQGIEEVKVGIAGPMSGSIAHLGKDVDSGARLAFDEVNANPPVINGKKIIFVPITVDDQSAPEVAIKVAHDLVDQKVVAVIGHFNSGATIPASQIYAAAGIPQISPGSTNPIYTHQGYKTAFRDIANDNQQMRAVSNFAFDQLKARKVAVIDDRTAAGQGQADFFVDNFKRRGGIILTRQFTTNTASDFMVILTTIKGTKPDLILYGGMDAQASLLVKQMKSMGIAAPLIAADGVQSSEFIRLAGIDAVGTYASSVGLPKEQMPGFKSFTAAFNAKYGEMQAYAPYSYDAAMILVQAMKEANSTAPAVFSDKIRSINYDGVTGVTKFDENGDLRDAAITIYKVNKEKNWEPVSTSLLMQ